MFGLSRYGDVEGGWTISAELSALLSPLVFRRASSPSSSWRLKQGSILALAGWMVVAAWLCAGVAEGVSMGGHHSCTVLEGGSVKCWGYNNVGQLGLGHNTSWGSSAEHVGNFADVELGEGFEAAGVTCGLDHSCAWSTTGLLKCWGGNAFGQLGYGDTVNRGDIADSMGDNLTYIHLGTGVGAASVVAANHFTCVLLSDLTIKCFGRNDWGQLGSGDATNNFGDSSNEMGDNLPIVPLVAPGANYTAYELAAYNGPCAVMQSDVAASVALKCWGPNGYGNLGLGDSYNRGDDPNEMEDFLTAVQLGSSQTVDSIVMGMDFVCAIVESRKIKCWGRNGNGQCGLGDVETYGNDPDEMGDNLPFVDLGTGRTVVSLTAGEAHLCALLDDDSVKCWGKGYYGATGHETWHSTGQIPNQMGNNLPTLDLGTFVSDSTSSTSSAPGRKLRGLGGVSRRSMQETGTGNTNYQVEYLAAGGQRSCAILDGGAVKCWGRAWAGSLGLGDTVDRGDRPGSMGDNLPTLDLGVGAVAVAPSPAEYVTIAPTPAPTMMPTPTPTLSPTIAPTPAPAISTPSPTTLAPVDLGGSSSISSGLDDTPSPTTPAPSTVRATTRSGFEGLADDVGVSVNEGIAIAAGMCAALLLVVCCCGYCMATKRSRDEKAAAIHSSSTSGTGGSRKKDAERHAAPICPLSASSRNHSRSGSHANSRAASFYGPDGAESLISDAKEQDEERMQEQLQREQVFCASNGGERSVEGVGTAVLSNDQVFYVEQRGVETKLEDGSAAGGGKKVNGDSKSAVNGGELGYAPGVVFARGVAEEESKDERVRERGDVRDASEAESEGLGSSRNGSSRNGSSRNGSLLAGRARSFRNAFIPGSSSSTTPARTRMKSAAAAMTPSYLRRASSSETPTHTWSGQYQVRPVEGSGSVTPESNAAESTFSQSREGASMDSSASQMRLSRNGSAVSSDMVDVPRP